jgi:hypothetical protein
LEPSAVKTFSLFSWIPLALWVAANIYISRFEGWGAWAAAPMLIIPLAVSLIFGVIGLAVFVNQPPDRRRSPRSLVSLVLPWLPILHLVVADFWRHLR